MAIRINTHPLGGTILGGGILVGVAMMGIGYYLWSSKGEADVNLPLIIIAGVVILLTVLGILTFSFSLLGLADKNEALGLPGGSIRAVIALMLLVIFAIIAIFLYSNVSVGGKLRRISGFSQSQVNDFRTNARITVVAVQTDVEAGVVTPPEPGKETPPKKETFTIWYQETLSPAGDEIAKQLIILLGTLVTSVASFYLGSNVVASAQTAMEKARSSGGGGPSATRVSPHTLNPDGSAQRLRIEGTNLSRVTSVKLTMDGQHHISADASSIRAEDAEVQCDVTVPKDAGPGRWNVVVSDNSDNDSTVRNAITIAGVTTPKPTDTAPAA